MNEEHTTNIRGRRSYDLSSDDIDDMLRGSDDAVHRAILVILQKVASAQEKTAEVLEMHGKDLEDFRSKFDAHDYQETKDRAALLGAKTTAQWFMGGYAVLLSVILSMVCFIFIEYRDQILELRTAIAVISVEQARLHGEDK